jgi:hypothetical protein
MRASDSFETSGSVNPDTLRKVAEDRNPLAKELNVMSVTYLAEKKSGVTVLS